MNCVWRYEIKNGKLVEAYYMKRKLWMEVPITFKEIIFSPRSWWLILTDLIYEWHYERNKRRR